MAVQSLEILGVHLESSIAAPSPLITFFPSDLQLAAILSNRSKSLHTRRVRIVCECACARYVFCVSGCVRRSARVHALFGFIFFQKINPMADKQEHTNAHNDMLTFNEPFWGILF